MVFTTNTLALLVLGFLGLLKTGGGADSDPLDNFGTTNSDVIKLCTEIVHH